MESGSLKQNGTGKNRTRSTKPPTANDTKNGMVSLARIRQVDHAEFFVLGILTQCTANA
jgi:hypothetical protein